MPVIVRPPELPDLEGEGRELHLGFLPSTSRPRARLHGPTRRAPRHQL